jgi:hypothetical protein
VRDQLPGLERELEAQRRLAAPAQQRGVARRLVEGLLDLDDLELAHVVRERHRESAQADPDLEHQQRLGTGTRDVIERSAMSEHHEQDPPASGGENRGVDEDVRSSGDEGSRNAEAAPTIADDAEKGQTQSPAAPDDVGVPSDEEMGRDED